MYAGTRILKLTSRAYRIKRAHANRRVRVVRDVGNTEVRWISHTSALRMVDEET